MKTAAFLSLFKGIHIKMLLKHTDKNNGYHTKHRIILATAIF
jgi:hypothetical protein